MLAINSPSFSSFDLAWEASTDNFARSNDGLIRITYGEGTREETFRYIIEDVEECVCCGENPCVFELMGDKFLDKAQTFQMEGLSEDHICLRLYCVASNHIHRY